MNLQPQALARPGAFVAARLAAADAGQEWSGPAASLLANLGFTLINGSRPGTQGSHLLVALRVHPTLHHFDPEAVTFYEPAGDKARPATVDRSLALQRPARRVLWGHVHVVDRLKEENRFLTFGGVLRSAGTHEGDADLVLLDLLSPGPILRWGGHSQGTDALSAVIGAFFGRLIIPIDFAPGIEARVDAVSPEVLYAAFLMDIADRCAAAGNSLSSAADLDAWTRAECRRIQRNDTCVVEGRKHCQRRVGVWLGSCALGVRAKPEDPVTTARYVSTTAAGANADQDEPR